MSMVDNNLSIHSGLFQNTKKMNDKISRDIT